MTQSLCRKNYLIVLSQLAPSGDKDFVKYASRAAELFTEDKEIFSIKKLEHICVYKISVCIKIS